MKVSVKDTDLNTYETQLLLKTMEQLTLPTRSKLRNFLHPTILIWSIPCSKAALEVGESNSFEKSLFLAARSSRFVFRGISMAMVLD